MREKNETNPLRDKLESEIIYKVFSANVPIGVYKEQFEVVNDFCKQNFMNNRWSMIWNLVVDAVEDYKYKMLYDEIQELKGKVEVNTSQPQPIVEEKKPSKFKTFGKEV